MDILLKDKSTIAIYVIILAMFFILYLMKDAE